MDAMGRRLTNDWLNAHHLLHIKTKHILLGSCSSLQIMATLNNYFFYSFHILA